MLFNKYISTLFNIYIGYFNFITQHSKESLINSRKKQKGRIITTVVSQPDTSHIFPLPLRNDFEPYLLTGKKAIEMHGGTRTIPLPSHLRLSLCVWEPTYRTV